MHAPITVTAAHFTWNELRVNLSNADNLAGMYEIFREAYPEEANGKIQNWGRQSSQFTLKLNNPPAKAGGLYFD